MSTATEVLLSILREVTALGDAPREIVAEKIERNLEQKLADGEHWRSEYAGLHPIDLTRAKFSEELRYEHQAKILVSSPPSGLFDMAHLVLDNEGEWKLRSFLSQCPACFGSGIVIDMDLCGSCGAKGWGFVNF